MSTEFATIPASRRGLRPLQPLEAFLREFVDHAGGAWDEVEPQVYDMLVGNEAIRVSFDPEALAEHPSAQLASLGSPLMDRLLDDARQRGAYTVLYARASNTHPYDLPGRLRRAYTFPENVELTPAGVRLCYFPQATYAFVATFISDRKEQAALQVTLDLHSGREVRQLGKIVSLDELSGVPFEPLPEAPHRSVQSGFNLALEQVARSISPLANLRRRELQEYTGRQIERMRSYYERMLEELEQQPRRAANEADARARHAARVEAVQRERDLRIGELRQKSALQVRLSLARVQVVHLPKLLVKLNLAHRRGHRLQCHAVFDSRADAFEPIHLGPAKPPTFDLAVAFT